MEPNQHIFCNTPWYELQIYWDGSFGICCQEAHKLYPATEQYNITTMTIQEWFNSNPVRQFRKDILGSSKLSACRRCYTEEAHSSSSRRIRSNQKSVIFTHSNFQESYLQSPGYDKFEASRETGSYNQLPIDLHIDLGNYCNLACKMCNAEASSVIAAQEVKWGNKESAKFIGSDWTRDETVWNRVLTEIVNIDNLHNIHFMGGETLITKRFEDFVDFMITHNRLDLNFSFVTNGTTFNEQLINKLKKFQRVGIEVSIETTTKHNAYQRQGTDTDLVLKNISKYLAHCNGTNITLTARPAISALTIGNYHTLLKFCWENKLIVKSLAVSDPQFLDVRVLPDKIRLEYLPKYTHLITELGLENINCQVDYNESDINNLPQIIRKQIDQCINLLQAPRLSDSLLTDMIAQCRRWDAVYHYDACELYPELAEEFINRGY